MSFSQEELVCRAQDGDVAAFDELVSRHQQRVFALAYHILRDAEDAADVQQETFLIAWKKLDSFRGQALFGTWLHRITVNLCISYRRKKSSLAASDQPIDDEPYYNNSGSSTTTCQNRLIDSIAVRQLLAEIPHRQRCLLLLREVDELSIDEIADLIGSSYSAVTQQLWRVRKLFRERLRQYLMEDEK